MAEEFKVITTQEELDNVIRDRIRRAKDAEAAKHADYSFSTVSFIFDSPIYIRFK